MEQILLNGITTEELRNMIRDVIKEVINISPKQVVSNNDLLSRSEVSKKLGVSLTTLNDWTKRGFLQSYRMGNRVYYKPFEVEESLIQVKNLKYRRG
jgi:excisionase family DNA binding protein